MATREQSCLDREINDIFCNPCMREGKEKFALKYCADCCDYYCTECVTAHVRFPALYGHKLVDMKDITTTEEKVPLGIPTERCKRHCFKLVDMFCQNHDKVGCNTYMAVELRSCQDVFYVQEYVQDQNPSTECEKIQTKMIDVDEDMKFCLKICEKEIKRLFKRKEEEVGKIKQFRININEKLDILEKKNIEIIEEKYKTLIKKYEEQISILKTLQTDLKSSSKDIKSASSNISQTFVGMKEAHLVTERTENILTEQKEDFKRVDFFFEGERKLINEMDRIGEITEKFASLKLEGKRETNIKHHSGKNTCDVISACILNDGSLIAADSSNTCLKRLDGTSYNIKDVCNLSRSPWQICQVDKEIAVSSQNKNIIFVCTDDLLKESREMKTDHRCFGLGYRNEKLYVTDTSESIFVYNKTGTKLSQFSKDQSGNKLFRCIFSLTVSQDGERIYVADFEFGLVVISKEGKIHGKYNSSKIKCSREICETDIGDILVCGEISNNIVLHSPHGEEVGEILPSEGKDEGYRAVCIDRYQSRLIVGRSGRDYIEVYDID